MINLPHTMTNDPKSLMLELSQTENIEYFENLTI